MLTYSIVAKLPSNPVPAIVSRGWTDLADAKAEVAELMDSSYYDWAIVVEDRKAK